MGRGWAWLTLLVSLAGPLGAQAVEPASAFLDSSPLGAEVTLDGQLTAWRTPVLMRGLSAGDHTVALWKDGYQEVTRTFRVTEGKVAVVQASLPPESVSLAFPEHETAASGSKEFSTRETQFRYPAGAYFLSSTDTSARLNPIFPDTGYLDTAGWAAALFGLGAAVASGVDTWVWSQGGPARPSAVTIAFATAAVGELIWYLALQSRQSEFYRETGPRVTPLPLRFDQSEALYADGNQALEVGDLAGGEATFRRLVRDYPSSTKAPSAWFRLARIHSVTGKVDLALGEYLVVAERFPQPATHDRARKALADLFEASDRPDLALFHLELMALNDGLVDGDTLADQKKRLEDAPVVLPTEETGEVTPSRAFDRTLTLFGQGHVFTAEELAGFALLREQLEERGDVARASDLDLIRVASALADQPPESREAWESRRALAQNRQSWLGVRRFALPLFQLAAGSLVYTASQYDRDHAPSALWAAGGAAAVMGLSLFPLLWAEPRQ